MPLTITVFLCDIKGEQPVEHTITLVVGPVFGSGCTVPTYIVKGDILYRAEERPYHYREVDDATVHWMT